VAKKDGKLRLSLEDVAVYRRVHPQLDSLLDEMRELSKKQPDGAVNKFKLEFINDKLRDANSILGDEGRPLRGFQEFDAAGLPSNSDVVMIVSQYLGSLTRWKGDRTERQGPYMFWSTEPPIRVD
jgi:hypothetical protein